eukprot:COSAG02_NODE_1296_length_13393_cov_15.825109_11_plen_117_part_00
MLATAIVRPRVMDWLHALVTPNRIGQHRNTAFSLSTLLDASRGDLMEEQIIEVAVRLFGGDTDAHDPRPVDSRGRAAFLSPSVRQTSTVCCSHTLLPGFLRSLQRHASVRSLQRRI